MDDFIQIMINIMFAILGVTQILSESKILFAKTSEIVLFKYTQDFVKILFYKVTQCS